MRLLGIFVTACVVLAAAQAVATALCLLMIAGLAYALFVAPRETLGFMGMVLIAGAFQAHPLVFLALTALATVAKLLHRRWHN